MSLLPVTFLRSANVSACNESGIGSDDEQTYADLQHYRTCRSILWKNEIVSRRVEGDIHRYNYSQCHQRVKKLANAFKKLQVQLGDRIATLAWNGYRHLEIYYAVSGSGAVLHTVNPRLHPEQISYIVNHAEDQYLFLTSLFYQLSKRLHRTVPRSKHLS